MSTLFCDIAGFTAMSERADPEDVDACLRGFGALAREVIERFGGSVEKYIGDAVVGVFGVPVVHEDDPERAVRAGLRLLDKIGGLRWADGSPLEARAGIMTGELLVAHDADPALGNGLVAGDAINSAARLEASADRGCLVVGDLTHRLTENAIQYERLPPWPAKGKARPMERWLALRPVARVDHHAGDERLSPLVGRDNELAFFVSQLRRVITGRKSQVTLILGDPGIGKTRLVNELFRFVDTAQDMITWRQGRCLPYGEGRTFWALREIVQAHCGILESHSPEDVAALLDHAIEDGPDHRRLCERLRPLVGLPTPDVDPEENYAAWLSFLVAVAARRPLVAVIEDLHWADEALLAFLDYAAQHLEGVPVLLVGTARPQVFELHPAFAASGGRVTRIWLDRLQDDETRSLVASLPEMRGRGARAVGHVALRAEGNPFFAEELARLLADCAGDAEAALAQLPHSVQAVIAARLDALSPQAKATLADGAVIGASFWRGALATLAAPAAGDIDVSLAELVERQLVRVSGQPLLEGEDEYAFCHGMVREVAYAELPRGVRAAKHAAFGRWLERRLGERACGDLSDVLAGHFGAAEELARAAGDAELAASVLDRAVRYLATAGEHSMGLDVRAASTALRARAGSGRAGAPGASIAALALGGGPLPGGPLPGVGGRAARGGGGTVRRRGLPRRRPRGGAARGRPLRARRPRRDAAAGGGADPARGPAAVPGDGDRARQARPVTLAGRRPAGRSVQA